jgi:hypothetical protein
MGNPEHCDMRHKGPNKAVIKSDKLGHSDFLAANNRILLSFSLD